MRRVIKFSLVALVLLVLLGAGLGYWGYRSLTTPQAHTATETSIIIERGLSTQGIVDRLVEVGIITNRYAALIWLRLTNGRHLKAGEYQFPSPISPLEALNKIKRGEVVLTRVTIPEGYNRYDTAGHLASKTNKADAATFEELTTNVELIADLAPQARNLEGYLFPETYTYTRDTTAADLIKQMVERFREVFTPAWRQRAQELDLSLHEIVTLASIIEEEAKVPDERPLIASVFYNRLKIGMPLATDPTFIYAAILAGDYDGNVNHPRHRARVSPYNTYLTAGLPPGPIASPGRRSLEAALYPAQSDYLYFVATGTDGSHRFSRTLEEHNRAVADYRRQLQLQRQQRPPDPNGGQ